MKRKLDAEAPGVCQANIIGVAQKGSVFALPANITTRRQNFTALPMFANAVANAAQRRSTSAADAV